MKIISFASKKVLFIIFTILFIAISFVILYFILSYKTDFIMGSFIVTPCNVDITRNTTDYLEDIEKYFRPSDKKIINTRNLDIPYLEISSSNIPKDILKDEFFSSPENTILNYYSLLRESANPIFLKGAGCGSIGVGTSAYPLAYNFLTTEYMKKINYSQYVNSFRNILHINLLKLRQVPSNNKDILKYFIELETIEGNSDKSGAFKYYYGYIDILNENGLYKINNIELYKEIYLCAPYHGWNYVAENVIDIEYGGWCNMVLERQNTIYEDNYIKKIPFKSTDGNEYMVEFFTLTNDVDIKIADYIKDKNGKWEYISFNPESCLDNK